MDAALIRQVWHQLGVVADTLDAPGLRRNPLIDHTIAKKHGGLTEARNLSLSCFYCNSFKGSDIAGRTPKTRKLTPLFNPRRHKWERHFRWKGPYLILFMASLGWAETCPKVV